MKQKSKPKFGQNFLVDDNARHAIADALGDISQRTVIEIGPGHGAITDILATRARRLIALELPAAGPGVVAGSRDARRHFDLLERSECGRCAAVSGYDRQGDGRALVAA